MARWIVGCAFLAVLLLSGADAGWAAEPVRGQTPGSPCPTLTLPPLVLPAAPEGSPYQQRLEASGGAAPVSLMVTGGSMAPGLTLAPSGELTGTPTAVGDFSFTVTATDSCRPRQEASQEFRLRVTNRSGADEAGPARSRKPPLRVTVAPDPATFALPAKVGSERPVRYRLIVQPAETATLSSPGGSFSIAGGVVMAVPTPLSVPIINGSGEVTELVTLPDRVVAEAKRQNVDKVTYSRAFVGRGTTALAVLEVTLEPPVVGR